MASDFAAVSELVQSGDPDAWKVASHLLTGNVGDWRALCILGHAALKSDQHGLGVVLMREAERLNPSSAEIKNNIGLCLLGCNDPEGAKAALRAALLLDPSNWQAMSNLALAYVQTTEPGMAIHWAEKALQIEPDAAAAEMKGYAHLMLRQWDQGWTGYESAMQGKVRVPRPHRDEPYWDGHPVDTLLVCGEQGIGDEVSFASMLPDVQAKNIVLECDHRLEGLFNRSFPQVSVYGTRWKPDERVRWAHIKPDAHCLIGSLGRYYRTAPEDFEGLPYLKADPERRLQWRSLLDTLPGKKVGIAWKGGKHHTMRHLRSLDLERLLPLLKTPGITWVSLEYKDPTDEIAAFAERHGIVIRHWPHATQTADYDDTAALVAELDSVVSVQTSVVHLAGGLGVPCHALIPSKPLWRYGMKGDDFPWARSVRLWRQRKDWPLEEVATCL